MGRWAMPLTWTCASTGTSGIAWSRLNAVRPSRSRSGASARMSLSVASTFSPANFAARVDRHGVETDLLAAGPDEVAERLQLDIQPVERELLQSQRLLAN